ncbi:MAG: prepilin peptidase [Endozoicomonadaceae bacterium]|nr:prepilin peptidase [Endozoicomonadaceae bacterium]
MFDILCEDIAIFSLLVGIIGLIVGSFLNVIIYRLPQMILNPNDQKFNLLLPYSHCPACNKPLIWWQNIPLLSYILLKGKCGFCRQSVSIQYPLIELLSAVMSAVAAYYYGCSFMLLAVLYFMWSLMALTCIDIKTHLLPDLITQPLLWVGLLFSIQSKTLSAHDAIYGAVLGYFVLWAVYWIFKCLTRQEGMGYGDFKLAAALGAWCGWESILLIISIASLLGSIWGISLMLFFNRSRKTAIPFGPFLALGGLIAFFFSDQVQQFILQTLSKNLLF